MLEWLEKYTEDCPKCKTPIEKNGGCNHMDCKNCNYAFCWVCRGVWSGSHYNCTASAPTSESRNLISRFDLSSALSFSQLYSIHNSSRMHDDMRIRGISESNMKNYLLEVKNAQVQNCEIILRALEHIFLVIFFH
jgi:hypothetical protein